MTRPLSCTLLGGNALLTVEFMHDLHQLQDAGIIDSIVDEIGIFPVVDNALVAQDGKVLGDIGVGGLYLFPDIADSHFPVLEKTKDLEPNGVRHGFQHAGNGCNLIVFQNDTLGI